MDNEFLKQITPVMQDYAERRNAVIEQAGWAMCEHYRCKFDDLVLVRTVDFPNQILKKEVPGLAYLIRVDFKEDSVNVVGEPIYLERDGISG